MSNYIDDNISDDEFRPIGRQSAEERRAASSHTTVRSRKRLWVALAGVAVVTIAVLAVWAIRDGRASGGDQSMSVGIEVNAAEPVAELAVVDTMVAGQPIQMIYLDGLNPSLHVGVIDTADQSIRVALQAADFRADNGEIVGDYVLAGERLSRGSSKQGYCEISDNQLSIGSSEESGCAQCAIDQKGYFFRQYLLVNNGKAQTLKPKGRHFRRALCMTEEGRLVLVLGQSELTFEDFAKVLESVPVSQAIYLTGGSAFGYRRTLDGRIIHFGYPVQVTDKPNVNYIVFK